jgi:histidyl-tRNA synthetase
MKNVIQSLKGTRDFYPPEMSVRTWLYQVTRQVSESFGYQEWDGPFLEPLELYAAKSGEELVKEQAYVFPDRSGSLIALRPELTPSLARMVAQRQGQLTFPLRWWSFGPFWRYERPQKGRSREFFQWNVDLIGVGKPEADAEIAAVMAAFFQKVGLTSQEVAILVNNRRLMDSELQSLGVNAASKPDVFRFIDRREKMDPEAWEKYGLELGLSVKQLDGIKILLSDVNLWEKSEELRRFFDAVGALGCGDYIHYDASIIRGLDYYTGTVIEAQELSGEFRRSILGGGRYDNLLAAVGGEPLPGTGIAMGDAVITLILESLGRIPEGVHRPPASVLVTNFSEEHLLASYSLTAELRQADIKVISYPTADKLNRQLKYAERISARLAIILGPDELQGNTVAIKDLHSREQITIPRTEMIQVVSEMLASDKSL